MLAEEAEAPTVAVRPLAGGVVAVLRELKRSHDLAGEVTVSDIARFPGALEVIDPEAEVGEQPRAEILAAVARALAGVDAMRTAEGATLAVELGAALARIEEG